MSKGHYAPLPAQLIILPRLPLLAKERLGGAKIAKPWQGFLNPLPALTRLARVLLFKNVDG